MSVYPLTHRQRLEAGLSGEKPDLVPVALWRHFPVDDQTPEGLAAATATFQRLYDFDLIKVSPSSSFCLRDWGVEDQWTGSTEGTRDYTKHPIQHPDDWAKLKILNPNRGSLQDQLTCLRILVTEFSPQVPIIQTIFSPLAQAKNLVGKDQLLVHMRQYPDALHTGLERITQTTIRFIEEVIRLGADGIFYAIQHAQYGLLTPQEFQIFSKVYDLRVLQATRQLWLNMAHIHGENLMFDMVRDYPVAIMNWHDRKTSPSLEVAQTLFNGMVCGGLRQWETMVLGNPKQVIEEAHQAFQATGGVRFMLGTGCVLPIIAPHCNILAARQALTIRGIL